MIAMICNGQENRLEEHRQNRSSIAAYSIVKVC